MSEEEVKMNFITQLQRARASHAGENRGGATRGWSKIYDAKRSAPYVRDSLKFCMARNFRMLPISKTEKETWSQHNNENFERFSGNLKDVGELEKTTSSAEDHRKLVMNRCFARPWATPVDKLYTYAQRQFDETFLRHIETGNNVEVFSMLQNVSHVPQLTDTTGSTLLHFAARYGNQDLAEHLINLGAAVDAQNRHYETPLMYAVKAGQEATVDLLLKHNADILLPGIRYCALGKALGDKQNVSEKIVTALMDRVTVESLNASEYAKTKQFHNTCKLYHFISVQNVDITRILLEKGSLVDAKSEFGATALHIAAELLDIEHVKLLLEFGADVNARKNNGYTPITSIHNFKDQNRALAVVRVLVSAGAKLFDTSSFAKMMEWPLLLKGNREIVRAALQCPIDLHSRNEFGISPLHYLARNQHADVFEELRGFDFDLNIRGFFDATLLHYAAGVGNWSSVKFLLDRGIDVNARDEFGFTPLIIAVNRGIYRKCIDDHLRCIETLLDHGAGPRFLGGGHVAIPEVCDKLALVAKPVVAYSALLEATGREIETAVVMEPESCSASKTIFELAKLHLKDLKGVRIFKSVTLFDVLTASDRKISMYARNSRLVFNLSNAIKECDTESYYHRRLSKRFEKLTHLAKMRRSVTVVVNEALSQIYDLNVENVAQNIVNHVEDEELYNMLPISQ